MKTKLSEELDFVLRCSTGYTESMFRHDGRFQNLVFGESGIAKLGVSLGAIMGIYLSGDIGRATTLAKGFLKTLENLSCFSELEIEDNGCKFKTPSSVVVLNDDGSTFGFSLGWYRYVSRDSYCDDLSSDQKRNCIQFGLWKQKYLYYMNGGLIFHGWNFSRTGFRNNLKECFGVHT